jgi:hypothetical protein
MVPKTYSPLPIEVEAGTKYSWCSCGFNQTIAPCVIIRIESFQISSLKKAKHCICVVALVHKRLHTEMAATTAEKSDGNRN